ncbi:MAG: hypothetical protein KC413_09295, partial [Anaerolineales bacterium]|nr:hypothetical protein [Anaerolineales bacterium]
NWPLEVLDDASDEIWRLTRGHPFLVQLLCSELVTWFNTAERRAQPHPRRAMLADVVQAAQRALHAGEAYFVNLWEDAGAEGQQVLAEIAKEPRSFVIEEPRSSEGTRFLDRDNPTKWGISL